MPKLPDLPLRGGTSSLIIGAPGTGKSEFASSPAKYGLKVKLLALRAKEIDSAGYMKYGINADAELFHDPGWMPSAESFEAGGFVALLKRLRELQTDEEYDVVVVDPITDVGDLILHEALKFEQVGTPAEADNSIRVYGDLKRRWTEFLKALTYLCYAKKPKHVIACVHAKPVQEEGMKIKGAAPKETADVKAREVQYFGDVLPMMEGSAKYDIGGEFQLQLFTNFSSKKEKNEEKSTATKPVYEDVVRYEILVRPDKDRFAKVALGYLDEASLPNDFGALLEAVAESMSDG